MSKHVIRNVCPKLKEIILVDFSNIINLENVSFTCSNKICLIFNHNIKPIYDEPH